MVTGKLIFLVILILLIIFFIYMKFNAPRGPHYKLKSIAFNVDLNVFHETGKLGKHIFTSKSKKKFILPWDPDIWTQVYLHENGIVLKRNKREIPIFFSELYAIEPLLVNSLFIIGKYFGYQLKAMDGRNIILKSSDLDALDIFIDKLCSLFPSEKGTAVITDID